jgi:receptor expression-enhancing protein 1/2/3/4
VQFAQRGSRSGGTVYAYPAYASLKTLSRRPIVDAELEHWLMYWSIVGMMLAYEHLAEWALSWSALSKPHYTTNFLTIRM